MVFIIYISHFYHLLLSYPCSQFLYSSVLDFLLSVEVEIVKPLSFRYIDMAESLCQKRALEAFRLDPEKWGGKY